MMCVCLYIYIILIKGFIKKIIIFKNIFKVDLQ
jgi:hypothetical protein